MGDFYWVRANVTPVVEGGEVTGYISIRSKPTRAQIEAADTGLCRHSCRHRQGYRAG